MNRAYMEKECEVGCPGEVGHPLQATELLLPLACKPELGAALVSLSST